VALKLPQIDATFPRNTRGAIGWFWVKYWLWFFVALPWMLLRQSVIIAVQLAGAIWTWNRAFRFLDGYLEIKFVNSLPALAVTMVFGERFTCIRYGNVLIDPGPVFARRRLGKWLAQSKIEAIVATHGHEEHIGNAPSAAHLTGAPIYGSRQTLAALRAPERLSPPRRVFIGQPEAATEADLRPLTATLVTHNVAVEIVESPGHCAGHASLFDSSRGILFAGDSFLHTIFTAPNREVRAEEWLGTLDEYLGRSIKTMVGTHGYIYTADPAVPTKWFVSRRRDPTGMIREKRQFLLWARDVVAEGERRHLPYSVIEACLFPWQRSWSWQNWFVDEGGRLFSAGEFSRTYFVRSLSRTPDAVPPRFGGLLGMLGAIRRAFGGPAHP
jgi:hydroxyacylglutathione hydrolase